MGYVGGILYGIAKLLTNMVAVLVHTTVVIIMTLVTFVYQPVNTITC